MEQETQASAYDGFNQEATRNTTEVSSALDPGYSYFSPCPSAMIRIYDLTKEKLHANAR
jgi:hypothetical protein